MATGLRPTAADYYIIDPDTFEVLVNRMFAANFRSTRPIGRAMLESVLVPSAVILERIDRPLSADTPAARAFLEWARALPMAC